MPWISVNNQLRWSNDDAQQAQRGEEGSPLPEVSAPSSAGQAEEGGQGGVPEARMSLELGSKLRETARWVVDEIDTFERRTDGVGTDTGDVWELFNEIRMKLRMHLGRPSVTQSSCLCGAGAEPCPGDDGRPLCAPKEETA